MKALKFMLSGHTAFFKKPDVNTYLYFTYGQIHKVALLGLIGAVVGLKGYNQREKEQTFPEFYERLQHLKIAIRPESEKGYFSKKLQTFNNSVGYASKEKGGNLIVKEQWLESPKWSIYIQLDHHPDGQMIEEHFLNRQFVYYPYLGKNDHFAIITEIELVELSEVNTIEHIDTLVKKSTIQSFVSEMSFFDDVDYWKYEEFLPIALNEETNLYETEACIFTNMQVQVAGTENFYKYHDQILYFI